VYVRRVVVGVSGSAGSLQALRFAVEMARSGVAGADGAVLVPVLAWTPPGGDLTDRRYPCPPLREMWKQAAWDRLWKAIDLAIGGPPADLRFSPAVVRGEAGLVLTAAATEPGDVLVISAGRPGALRRMVSSQVSRYCLAHARCPMIAVPPTRLAADAQGLHGWVLRRRMHPEDWHTGVAT
jgi:nucleotide-binding universal stress UspA family protein